MIIFSGAAPTELQQQHREILGALDSQMFAERKAAQEKGDNDEKLAVIQFKRTEDIQLAEIERRKEIAAENILRITDALTQKMKSKEHEWQLLSIRWLSTARRKVAIKLREDENAKAGKKKRTGGR